MVAAVELVEIGDHCMFANGCFVTDGAHRFDDPDKPVTWQGFTSKGPTTIGDNVWCGANVVVTWGVTVGERCVIGANSVVTQDLPPRSIAAGAPARVLREIEYGPEAAHDQVEAAVLGRAGVPVAVRTWTAFGLVASERGGGLPAGRPRGAGVADRGHVGAASGCCG